MERELSEILKEKGKCCISGKPLSTSRYINFVAIDYAPEWAFPFESNCLHPNRPKRAVAVIHDDEVIDDRTATTHGVIKFAIEYREEGEEIIYHPVENLQSIRYVEES